MNVLPLGIENHHATVIVAALQVKAVQVHLLEDDLLSENAEVARDDEVIILRLPAKVFKMLPDGIDRGGRHRGAHVVGVLDAEVLNFADSRALNKRAFAAA